MKSKPLWVSFSSTRDRVARLKWIIFKSWNCWTSCTPARMMFLPFTSCKADGTDVCVCYLPVAAYRCLISQVHLVFLLLWSLKYVFANRNDVLDTHSNPEVFCVQVAHNHAIRTFTDAFLIFLSCTSPYNLYVWWNKLMDSCVWVGALLSSSNSKFLQNKRTSVNEEFNLLQTNIFILIKSVCWKQIREKQLQLWKFFCL